MIKVIDGHGLNARVTIEPESQSLNLGEKDSTSALTVGTGAPDVSTGEWVQDMSDPGRNIVWRVKSVDTQYNTETRTINLEHLINVLADRIIPDEVTAETMGGAGGCCTARQAINHILSYQSDWVLGSFDYDSVSNPYKFDSVTLKAALETVSSSLEDPIWEYNFSTYPFRLNIRKLSNSVESEMRGGRNLQSIKYTVDRSRMYTRFYPTGKNNLQLPGKYVSRNENKYGRIDKAETDQSKATVAELTAWANDKLLRHADPYVTVTVSGLDMSSETGEALDELTIGKRCRVLLPEDDAVISEKITRLSWRDKIKDPESVQVTMANATDDVASIIKEETAKSGGGAKSAAKADEANETLIGSVEKNMYSVIAQTSTNIYMSVVDMMSGYATIELTASMISASVSTAKSDMYSCIMQTATSITLTVASVRSDMYSQIEQTASSITLTVATARSDLYSCIMQTATSITLSVNSAKSSLWSSIVQTSTSISLKVGKGEVISCINQTAESITINASKINLSGYVTASDLSAVDAKVDNLTTGVTKASYIKTTQFLISDNYFTLDGGNIRLRTINVNGVDHHLLGTD